MDQPLKEPGLLERNLAPYPLFLGIIVSFAACCAAGLIVSRKDCIKDFVRFNVFTGPQTLMYPTASQVRSLAGAHIGPEKVIVVIGGNSILQGFGQRQDFLWTRKLQALLGDRFHVINLAMSGAFPPEFGGWAAEMLAQEQEGYPRHRYEHQQRRA